HTTLFRSLYIVGGEIAAKLCGASVVEADVKCVSRRHAATHGCRQRNRPCGRHEATGGVEAHLSGTVGGAGQWLTVHAVINIPHRFATHGRLLDEILHQLVGVTQRVVHRDRQTVSVRSGDGRVEGGTRSVCGEIRVSYGIRLSTCIDSYGL